MRLRGRRQPAGRRQEAVPGGGSGEEFKVRRARGARGVRQLRRRVWRHLEEGGRRRVLQGPVARRDQVSAGVGDHVRGVRGDDGGAVDDAGWWIVG